MNRALYMREYMRRRRAETDTVNTCPVCGATFTAKQEAKTCSARCKQKAYRRRVTDVVNTPSTTPAAVNPAIWGRPSWEAFQRHVTRGDQLVRIGTATIDYDRTWRWATDKPNTPAVTPPVNNVTPAASTLAVAWRYRMANNYAAGTLVKRVGPIDRASVEASLREQFGRDVIELRPCV